MSTTQKYDIKRYQRIQAFWFGIAKYMHANARKRTNEEEPTHINDKRVKKTRRKMFAKSKRKKERAEHRRTDSKW